MSMPNTFEIMRRVRDRFRTALFASGGEQAENKVSKKSEG